MACCEAFLESLVIVLGLIKDTSGMTLELRAEAVEQVLTTLEDDCRYDVNRYPEIRVGAKNGSPEGFAERREEGGEHVREMQGVTGGSARRVGSWPPDGGRAPGGIGEPLVSGALRVLGTSRARRAERAAHAERVSPGWATYTPYAVRICTPSELSPVRVPSE